MNRSKLFNSQSEFCGTWGLGLDATKWYAQKHGGAFKSQFTLELAPEGVTLSIVPVLRRDNYFSDKLLNGLSVDYFRRTKRMEERFEGEFRNNKRNGYGKTFDWTGACIQEGQYIDGIFQG